MRLSPLFGWLKEAKRRFTSPCRAKCFRRASCAPRLEILEDRTVPSTFTVRNLQDSGTGSLRQAILNADEHPGTDVIDFAPGVSGTIKLTSGDLTIDTSLTINGPGAAQLSISGDNASRIFEVDAGQVAISGLTLTAGRATTGGGILLNGGAALSLSNCTLTDNEALGNAAGGGYGGGIEDTSSGALTVASCTFDTNKAVAVGSNGDPNLPGYIPGAVFAFGGAVDMYLASTGPTTIVKSTFTGNQALGDSPGASAGGGALSNSSHVGAVMTVTGCTLTDNAAIGAANGDGITNFGSGQGGGINDFGTLIVDNSTLTGNVALGTPLAPGAVPSQTVSDGSGVAGGGIFCLTTDDPASVAVANSSLTGNQAIGGAGAAGSAGSIGEGGGLAVVAGSGVVTNCTIADNVARGGAGGSGGVGAPGASGGLDLAFGSSLTVSNSAIIGNQAIGGAGGVGASGGDGVGGGANVGTVVLYGGPDNCSLSVTGSTFLGNQAIGGAGGSGGTGGDGLGGGLSVLAGSSASISSTTFIANLAVGGAGSNGSNGLGGGVYVQGGALASIDPTWIVANAALGGAGGQGIGGGLYIGADASVTPSEPAAILFNFASTEGDDVFGSYSS